MINTYPEESERFVVSTAMQDVDCYADAIESGIKDDSFTVHACKVIWQKIGEMIERSEDVSLTSVTKRLPELSPTDIVDVYKAAPSFGALSWHIEQVVNATQLRDLRRISEDALREIETTEEPDKLFEKVETEILQIREETEKEMSKAEILSEIVTDFERALKTGFKPEGLLSGFYWLDRMINGLEPGKLYIIAARPAMGKTALLGNIVEHLALNVGKTCLFVSAEMSEKELLKRFVFGHAGVSLSEMVETGMNPTKGQQKRIAQAVKAYHEAPIEIYDKSGPTLAAIRAKARRIKRRGSLDLIAVDYLQLLRGSGRSHTRENEINMISQGLKALSKDMECPVVCLAQLNRGPENRTGEGYGIPRMSDLRESGAIEQDADVISLLYRPGYYDKENEDLKNVGKLIIAKNRSGATGTIDLDWQPSTMRFAEKDTQAV